MFDSYESTIGERIRYYRKRSGLTQKAVAEACGITEPAIRNYELDNRIPSYETLEEIASALNVSYYALADPILGAYSGVMHCFFRLEYAHGLKPTLINGKPALVFDSSNNKAGDAIIQQMMRKWLEARMKLDSGEWTLDQYEDWECQYPVVLQSGNPEDIQDFKTAAPSNDKNGRHIRQKKNKKNKAK